MGVEVVTGSADVRAVLEGAEQAAREDGAPEVGPEHVLLSLARRKPGPLGAIFERYKVTPEALKAAFPRAKPQNGGDGRAATEGPSGDNPAAVVPPGPLPPAPEIADAVARAGGAASALGRGGFEATDLLLAMLQDRASRTTEILEERFDLTTDRLVADLRQLRGQERMIARAEGERHCDHHPAEAAGVEGVPAGGTGLAAELRALDGRHRALFANFIEVRDRQKELVRFIRVMWVVALLQLAGLLALGVLAYLKGFAR